MYHYYLENQLHADLNARDSELEEFRRRKQREESHLMTFKEEIGIVSCEAEALQAM